MKKIIFIILIMIIGVSALASSSLQLFSYGGQQWMTSYSQEIGNIYLLETLGTTGVGGAAGFITTNIDRQKIGFLNLMVGKTTYAVAIGFNTYPIVPAAYFEYDTMRTIAPIFYDLKFIAGNYGLPNFGITLDGRSQLEFASFSLYAQEHLWLIFEKDLDTLANVDLSYKDVKGSVFLTNEIGQLYFLTGGLMLNNIGVSLDTGIGFNVGEEGLAFGLSSARSSMGNSWMIRYMYTGTGPSFYVIFVNQNDQLMFGYNMGTVYLSIEN